MIVDVSELREAIRAGDYQRIDTLLCEIDAQLAAGETARSDDTQAQPDQQHDENEAARAR